MSHEFLRMQKLSGVITESEYNQKIEELNSAESSTETLNENVVGIGSVLNPYPTKKEEVYEAAFNKFLTEEKEEMEEEKEEMEEAHCYEEPVGEAKEEVDETKINYDASVDEEMKKDMDEEMKKDLDEDARTDAEEEGYQDGFKDALKDVKDALAKLRKQLKEEDIEEMGMRYEEPVEERVTKKEKEEGDMRDKGGESAQTRETERMKSMGRK